MPVLAAAVGLAGPAATAAETGIGTAVGTGIGTGVGTTTRLAAGQGGAPTDGQSFGPAVSGDGRLIAFYSQASNLVPDDRNGWWGDVFVRDRQTGRLTLLSSTSAGKQFAAESHSPAVSADGRFVAFTSDGPLVAGDTNRTSDVFVRELATGTVRRVSLTSGGLQAAGASSGPAISRDGRYVAFVSDAALTPGAGGHDQVYVRDTVAGTTTRVSSGPRGAAGSGDSLAPAISADGRTIAFESWAPDLVAGDRNDTSDVFVRDLKARTTARVDVSSTGAPTERDAPSSNPAVSADGRLVAFYSTSGTLVPGDTNREGDVFVRDRFARSTTRVSVSSGGRQGSGDSGAYSGPAISGDGRHVAFGSAAPDLVPGDTNGVGDVFVRDRFARTTERVSVSSRGGQGDLRSDAPALSADGRVVTFESEASTLVTPDRNGISDVFAHLR